MRRRSSIFQCLFLALKHNIRQQLLVLLDSLDHEGPICGISFGGKDIAGAERRRHRQFKPTTVLSQTSQSHVLLCLKMGYESYNRRLILAENYLVCKLCSYSSYLNDSRGHFCVNMGTIMTTGEKFISFVNPFCRL